MTTIEAHAQQRAVLLQAIKEAHQQLIKSDIAFWTNRMKVLFERFPTLETVSWKQGFFYNDEHYAFQTTDFKINGLEIQENNYSFSPRYRKWSSQDVLDANSFFLVHLENDKAQYDEWRKDRYAFQKEESAFRKVMQEKYHVLLPITVEIVKLLNETYINFGERHFADTFGKKALIIFNKEGLLVEDYEDYEASSEGVLEDLIP
jgi:hypothetical protein